MKKKLHCRDCKLYNKKQKYCTVIVLLDGEKINLPTDPGDACVFEEEYSYIDENGETQVWKPEVNEIKIWCENPVTGEKSDKGVVKIEYPKNFFPDITCI